MTPQILIDECRKSGVALLLDGCALKLRGEPHVVAEVATKLRPHKAELLQYFREHACNDATELNGADGRPASEWLAMIKELDALIDEFCNRFRLSDEQHQRILEMRYRQSLASIPGTLEWFRRELGVDSTPNNAEQN
ncbi:hypothetical protein [Noviherbaspirillum autotrophicum]|uniref:TubC N-terminal docking domain-containing protein n=1 Tax=Noviherbaspirillum autotrophicum TaxID=709839 RepID=A0A0C2BJ81_9BURK|nr:hypothetical protein [Noviherbaspirillum autotrophicum]KIF81275.1 hypothetical protein TSA66_11285 [Noviherbaspirillum autotrophicum]